jgi:hypothetical protein
MEPFANDESVQEEESTAATPADAGVVTGAAPYDAADDEDAEED